LLQAKDDLLSKGGQSLVFRPCCKTRSLLNFILRYADYLNLLLPENSDVPIDDEMQHIMSWSATNRLSINLYKCKELVFWRPGLKSELFALPDVVHVTCCIGYFY